jgi:hypothetical protein
MVKKLMLGFMLVMAYQNAFAVSLVYKFNVNSSGTDMYACNAGIRHVESQICHIRGQPNVTCDPNLACGPGQNCNISNCVCTQGQASNRLDEVVANYTRWTDHGYSAAGPVLRKVVEADGSWKQLFTDVDAWNWELTSDDIQNTAGRNLVFNLTSEAYGTEYFVDICYRGPRIPVVSTGGQFVFASSTYGDDSFGEQFPDGVLARYLPLSKLKASVQVQCFNQPSAFTGAQSWGPTLMEGQTINFASGVVLASLPNIPKFCKIRYTYKETASAFRANTTQKARMCTDTSIDEPRTVDNVQL